MVPADRFFNDCFHIAKHIDEKKKIEEKLERAAEQCSLDNQMSIFDLFPDF